jgi:hypothetical protein
VTAGDLALFYSLRERLAVQDAIAVGQNARLPQRSTTLSGGAVRPKVLLGLT